MPKLNLYFALQMELEKYMDRCIQLAINGLGRVAPNPMVGSVLVKGDRIIGEGYHRVFGQAHAEVNAIAGVADVQDLKGATLFVNLEPCSHTGKTPPCADLIIKTGIPRVVIANTDPNPAVAGKGIAKLRAAGIEVVEHIRSGEGRFLNRRFFTFQEKKRPYIILKWAQSADGFMDRDRKNGSEAGINWISHPATKKLVHLWRSQEQAILVGSRTILNDDPQLDTREVAGTSPIRVILAGSSLLPPNAKALNGSSSTLVYHGGGSVAQGPATFINAQNWPLPKILEDLYKRNISSVLVEGGAETLSRFIDAKIWDEARIIQSESWLGGGLRAPIIGGSPPTIISYGADQIHTLYNQ